jgi:hypothetical protein
MATRRRSLCSSSNLTPALALALLSLFLLWWSSAEEALPALRIPSPSTTIPLPAPPPGPAAATPRSKRTGGRSRLSRPRPTSSTAANPIAEAIESLSTTLRGPDDDDDDNDDDDNDDHAVTGVVSVGADAAGATIRPKSACCCSPPPLPPPPPSTAEASG